MAILKEIKIKRLRRLGKYDKKYEVWRQGDSQMKRKDINPSKLYLVMYSDMWLIGRFGMQWYGWNFQPNLGSMSIQIDHLQDIYEIIGLSQKVEGSTEAFILNYLSE